MHIINYYIIIYGQYLCIKKSTVYIGYSKLNSFLMQVLKQKNIDVFPFNNLLIEEKAK